MQITEDQKSRIRDELQQTLGDSYDCTRAWCAWSYGTMTEDDFIHIAEDYDRIEEITEAVTQAILGQ